MVKICPSILTLYPNTHHTTHSDSTLTFSLPPKPPQPGMGNPCTDHGKCYHCEENLYLRSIHVLTNRTEIYNIVSDNNMPGGIWAHCDIRNQTQDRQMRWLLQSRCVLTSESEFLPSHSGPHIQALSSLPGLAHDSPISAVLSVVHCSAHFSVFWEWCHPPFSAKTQWLAVCVSDLYSSVALFSSSDTGYSLSSILFGYLSCHLYCKSPTLNILWHKTSNQ